VAEPQLLFSCLAQIGKKPWAQSAQLRQLESAVNQL